MIKLQWIDESHHLALHFVTLLCCCQLVTNGLVTNNRYVSNTGTGII